MMTITMFPKFHRKITLSQTMCSCIHGDEVTISTINSSRNGAIEKIFIEAVANTTSLNQPSYIDVTSPRPTPFSA